MIRLSPGAEPHPQLLSRMANYARRIEANGFPGIWVGDSMGRGRPTLDPLTALAALAAVTERVELGIGVLQVSLRHPVELAHRVQSVQALSGRRQRLDASGFRIARRRLRPPLPHVAGFARDHAPGVARRAGSWRQLVGLA